MDKCVACDCDCVYVAENDDAWAYFFGGFYGCPDLGERE